MALKLIVEMEIEINTDTPVEGLLEFQNLTEKIVSKAADELYNTCTVDNLEIFNVSWTMGFKTSDSNFKIN